MNRNLRAGLVVAVMASAACASTEMTSVWKAPNAQGIALSRVAVVALTTDEGVRRLAEDEAARQIKGTHLVPSYQVLGNTDLRNREAVKAQLRAAGIDGVLVMRVASVSEQATPVHAPYTTFDGYYGWASGTVYAPGYVQVNTLVHVVSSLYALANDELIWFGVSKTFDPSSEKDLVVGVSRAVAKELEKDWLIAA